MGAKEVACDLQSSKLQGGTTNLPEEELSLFDLPFPFPFFSFCIFSHSAHWPKRSAAN